MATVKPRLELSFDHNTLWNDTLAGNLQLRNVDGTLVDFQGKSISHGFGGRFGVGLEINAGIFKFAPTVGFAGMRLFNEQNQPLAKMTHLGLAANLPFLFNLRRASIGPMLGIDVLKYTGDSFAANYFVPDLLFRGRALFGAEISLSEAAALRIGVGYSLGNTSHLDLSQASGNSLTHGIVSEFGVVWKLPEIKTPDRDAIDLDDDDLRYDDIPDDDDDMDVDDDDVDDDVDIDDDDDDDWADLDDDDAGDDDDADQDGDGIEDAYDRCPLEGEDIDDWEDTDGCPDKDNDSDGLEDGVDVCPNDAETVNGFEDEDGCPDEVPDSDDSDTDDAAAVRARALEDAAEAGGADFESGNDDDAADDDEGRTRTRVEFGDEDGMHVIGEVDDEDDADFDELDGLRADDDDATDDEEDLRPAPVRPERIDLDEVDFPTIQDSSLTGDTIMDYIESFAQDNYGEDFETYALKAGVREFDPETPGELKVKIKLLVPHWVKYEDPVTKRNKWGLQRFEEKSFTSIAEAVRALEGQRHKRETHPEELFDKVGQFISDTFSVDDRMTVTSFLGQIAIHDIQLIDPESETYEVRYLADFGDVDSMTVEHMTGTDTVYGFITDRWEEVNTLD